MKQLLIILLFTFFLFTSCNRNEKSTSLSEFQPLDSVVFDQDLKKVGERLFFDKQLSVDNTVSCASCHIPALAFTDGIKLSQGIHQRLAKRNSPTLTGVVHQDKFMWDGGVETLEMQALVPLQDTNEMGSRVSELILTLEKDRWYDSMSKRLYNHSFNAYTLTRALGHFQRSLYKENSVFDDWKNHDKNVSESIKRGFTLFNEELNCAACHSGRNFTNNKLENNGLYSDYPDLGRYIISGDSNDIGKFKVPTLRNIEITAPYMHDGSLETLEKVIDHYQKGGENHINKSDLIQPFKLSKAEKTDLINFLKSLTDKDLKSHWEKVFN
ncbi:MAG: cytochrome c peroxidase [Brumimicrobium sp.]